MRVNKKKIVSVTAVTIFLLLIAVVAYKDTFIFVKTDEELVNMWLSEFTENNYKFCDNLVGTDSDRLTAGGSKYTGTYEKSYELYEASLDMAVDCIEEIHTTTESGKVVVDILVCKREVADSVKYDKDNLKDLKDKYLNSELSEGDFRKQLSNEYYNAFMETVGTDITDNLVELSCELSIEDGKIKGVFNMVRQILDESNILKNIEYYERNINSTFNVVLREKD